MQAQLAAAEKARADLAHQLQELKRALALAQQHLRDLMAKGLETVKIGVIAPRVVVPYSDATGSHEMAPQSSLPVAQVTSLIILEGREHNPL